MTAVARVLQIHEDRWRWLEYQASVLGATSVVLSSYLLFAFIRFGWPDFALRPTVRLLLIGLYGWIGLALAAWAISRLMFSTTASPRDMVRLTGHAHLPLLVVGVVIQVAAVMVAGGAVAFWVALFVATVWMPALLVAAVAAATGLARRRAALVVAGPYALWALVVGRHVWRLLEHLL